MMFFFKYECVLLFVKTEAWKPNIFSKFNNLIDVYPFETFYDLIKEIHSYSQYVHTIEKDLKHITFNVLDAYKRNHLIKTYIPIEYVMTKKQPLHFETKIPIVAVNSLVKVIIFYFNYSRYMLHILYDF